MITAFFMIYTLHKYSLAIHYSTIAHACASTTSSNLMPAVFLAPAAFEFTLFSLTGYRAWQDVKLVTSRSSAPFLVVLYRDGIICFFVMFGVRIWNVWIYATQPITSAYLGIYLLWATMTILSTRVYLNLQFLTRGSRTDTESDFTIGTPQFAVPANPGMTTTNAIFANITQGDFPHSICLQERSSHSPGSPINNARATFLSLSDTETTRSNDRLESPSRTFGHKPFSTISLSFASMPSSNA
ncbi:hypothetical protein FRC18_007960 [Serendipita sp. 400]|nr:hypothetical protein FRC18_007960 [Serendipita sp. 400]